MAPGLLMMKADGVRVMVAILVVKALAVAVTVSVPVPASDWMKKAGDVVLPAGTVTMICPLPAPTAVVDRRRRLASELTRVTGKPPAGAAAPRKTFVDTWRSRPMVWSERLIVGAVTV